MRIAQQEWRERYEKAGVKTIPLPPNRKKRPLRGYETMPSSKQWRKFDTSTGANIAILPTGKLVVIDVESQAVFRTVLKGLASKGVDTDTLPVVKSASGIGRHIYIKSSGKPHTNDHYALLKSGLGGVKKPGELRYGPRAYCMAPASVVSGNRYDFVQGQPEWIRRVPVLDPQDLAWLTPDPDEFSKLSETPIRLLRRPLPREAENLFSILNTSKSLTLVKFKTGELIGKWRGATKGEAIPLTNGTVGNCEVFRWYDSRSEAEQAIVTYAVLAGWEFEEILAEFTRRRPPHFTEHNKPAWYLRLSYEKAIGHVASDPIRQEIADAYQVAALSPWPGRGGELERFTLLALLTICWQFGSWQIHASQRDLALLSGATQRAIGNALKRLEEDEYIEQARDWVWTGTKAKGAEYRVSKKKILSHKSPLETYGGVPHAYNLAKKIGLHPIWCKKGLGRTAGHIYDLIVAETDARGDLVEASGKSVPTVRKALGILEERKMIEGVDGIWVLGETSRDDVSAAEGLDALMERRQSRYEMQRRLFAQEKPSGRQWSVAQT